MAKRYTGVDVTPWKLVGYDGGVLRDDRGYPLQGFNGFKSAMAAAFGREGAVAVRQ